MSGRNNTIHLILARSLPMFIKQLNKKFHINEIETINASQGKVEMKNGDEYIYVPDAEFLRGRHGVKVLMWSKPDWYNDDNYKEIEELMWHARRP
jgi:hypothetical protein